MRVLVTGATGFVGSHLVEALVSRGACVRALVRATSDTRHLESLGVERWPGGLEDATALARAMEGVGVVYHLAALTRARTAAEYQRVNAGGTRRVLEAARMAESRPRLVYLSSLAAVGPSFDGIPVARETPPRPVTEYGRSKRAGEEACLPAVGELEVAVLRAPAVYGPRDRDLYRFFSMAARGLLAVPGGGDRPIQFVFVRDLAESLVLAGTAPAAAGVYHVAEPRAYGSEAVARLIAEAVGKRARVVTVPPRLVEWAATASEWGAALLGRATIFNRDKARELLAPSWLCETASAERELGFVARTPLPEGLKETAAWYRASGWL